MSAQATLFCFPFMSYVIACCFFLSLMPINYQLWDTRGHIPDISPRGYVGLVESCVVSPKNGIPELVSKYSLQGLTRHIAIIDGIKITCRQHELYHAAACTGVITCQMSTAFCWIDIVPARVSFVCRMSTAFCWIDIVPAWALLYIGFCHPGLLPYIYVGF